MLRYKEIVYVVIIIIIFLEHLSQGIKRAAVGLEAGQEGRRGSDPRANSEAPALSAPAASFKSSCSCCSCCSSSATAFSSARCFCNVPGGLSYAMRALPRAGPAHKQYFRHGGDSRHGPLRGDLAVRPGCESWSGPG